MTLTSQTWAGHVAMLAFSALVAGSFALGGLVANEIAPAAFNAVRFTLALAVIAALVIWRGGPAPGTFHAPWRYLILGGLYGAYFVAMFEGLKTAEPVTMSAVFTLAPILSAGFGWVMLRQVTTPRMALGLAVGAVGALWVIFRADLQAFWAFDLGRGEAIFFCGCICHAAYTPAVRWLSRGEPILSLTFATLATAAVLLWVVGGKEALAYDWSGAPAILWVTLAYTAFAATAFTVYLVQFAALRLPAAKVMAYTYLVPSWVAIWQIALGGALPPVLVLAGVCLTIAALLILLRD